MEEMLWPPSQLAYKVPMNRLVHQSTSRGPSEAMALASKQYIATSDRITGMRAYVLGHTGVSQN